jgi:hypothetical protein
MSTPVSEYTTRSPVTISTVSFGPADVAANGYLLQASAHHGQEFPPVAERCSRCLIAGFHLGGLFNSLVDCADHIERLLRQVVVLAFQDLLEAPDGL